MSTTGHRVLLISYAFPPTGGIAVQRILSFAKYLPSHGHEVHVLTARNPASPVYDPGLLRHVPPQVQLHRTWTLEPPFHLRKKWWGLIAGKAADPSPRAPAGPPPKPAAWKQAVSSALRRLLCPDPQVLWTPSAIRRAGALIRRRRIDTVLVTAPPFSTFLIGAAVKRRFPEVRLVADFRDEWLRFYLTDFDFLSSDYTRRRAAEIEREIIERADIVIAVTRTSLAEIRGRYPGQPESKFAFLPNGYDPEVFASFQPRPHGQPRMVVTHMGTAYRTASPRYYLDAVDALDPDVRATIETRFVGRIAETEQEIFANRLSPVRLIGFLPQQEALRQVEETDFLLLTMTNDFSLPGKLFEYMATGKPILALSPPGGEVARLLEETGAGVCVPHDNPEAIAGMLRAAWRRVMSGQPAPQVRWDRIRRYERPRVAAELSALLRGAGNP
jgi:glycosyltransferase involved in cell wall biosynthesis